MASRWDPDAQMASLGLGWDTDVWVAHHKQEETHMSGVLPKARNGTPASRVPLTPGEDPGISWGFWRGTAGGQWVGVSPSPSALRSWCPWSCCHPEGAPAPAAC